MPYTKCRTCGAPILWAKTTTGKRMPIDAQPRPDGNVLLEHDGTATVMGGLAVWPPDAERYVSHFATCPSADQHRRRS